MKGTLVLTILTVRSSYLRELEQPLGNDTDVPDTIQWWVASTGTWRIKTFAIDHDIHTFSVEGKDSLIELALANAQKHYGDVILSNHVIKLHDCRDPAEVIAAFRAEGLEPRLEIAEGRFAFWKPDDGKYHSQSQPR